MNLRILALCGLLAAFLFSGCSSMPNALKTHQARNTTFTVDLPFDAAYGKAIRTFGALGMVVISQDAEAGSISAVADSIINMNVSLNKVSDTQTEIAVYGSVIPGRIAWGGFTAVDDYKNSYLNSIKGK